MYYNPPALKHLVFSSWENIEMTVFYQRRSHDFFKGGHTVSNRGYSSDFRVDPHALFYIRPKKAYKRGAGGGFTPTPGPHTP